MKQQKNAIYTVLDSVQSAAEEINSKSVNVTIRPAFIMGPFLYRRPPALRIVLICLSVCLSLPCLFITEEMK